MPGTIKINPSVYSDKRDAAGLLGGAGVSAARDIKELGDAGKNIQKAAGAAQGRAMSRSAGFDVEMRYGTEAEAAAEYKDVDLGFGRGVVKPPPDTDGSNFR